MKVDAGRAGTILFLSQPAGLYNAVLGGIMAQRAKLLGVEAVVIDGQLRDINDIRRLQLPVSSFSPPSLTF
jgi:regulator of RNase E activity RraA